MSGRTSVRSSRASNLPVFSRLLFSVDEQDLQRVREALVGHIALTRAESGCITFNVTENAEIDGRFDVYEEFVDSEAFAAHQARVQESKWGEVSKNVTRHYSIDGLD